MLRDLHTLRTGKSPFLVGKSREIIRLNDNFSIAMLVYWRVTPMRISQHLAKQNRVTNINIGSSIQIW